MTAEKESLLSRITMCRLGHAKGTETEEILYQAHNEIERLQNIQRDFHNLDDVAEIRRLREVLIRLRDEPAQDEAWDMDDVHTLVLQALAGGRAHDTGSPIDVAAPPREPCRHGTTHGQCEHCLDAL